MREGSVIRELNREDATLKESCRPPPARGPFVTLSVFGLAVGVGGAHVKHRELRTLTLLIIVIVAAAIKAPRFIEASSINSILLWAPLLIVVGMGQMLVIVTRASTSPSIDGGALCDGVGNVFEISRPFTLVMGVLVGVAVGHSWNDQWSRDCIRPRPRDHRDPRTLSAYRGLIFILSHGVQVDSNDLPDSLSKCPRGSDPSCRRHHPWLIAAALAIAGLMNWFVRRTERTGRVCPRQPSRSARLRGIPVARVTFIVYAITGPFADWRA